LIIIELSAASLPDKVDVDLEAMEEAKDPPVQPRLQSD